MIQLLMVLFIAVALLIIGLAVPLMRRRVRPNRFYGLRVSATLADEWVWYEANARTGRDLLLLGLIELTVAGLAPLVLRLPLEAYALLNASVLLVGALAVALIGGIRAQSLLKQRERGDREPEVLMRQWRERK